MQRYCKIIKWKITGSKYRKITNIHGCFLSQHILRNMNQLSMIQGRNGKISASSGGTETIVWNICSYMVPAMVRTNASTNKNHNFYNSTVQAILRRGDCATKVGALCDHFFSMGASVKTRIENRLSKLLDCRGQTFGVSDQAGFTLNDLVLHDKEVKKKNLATRSQQPRGCQVVFCLSL